MSRPPAGTRWEAPEMMTMRMTKPFIYRIDDRAHRQYAGLVPAVCEKRYVTRDQWDWPVYHKAGEPTLLREEDFGRRLFPADEATLKWWKENHGEAEAD